MSVNRKANIYFVFTMDYVTFEVLYMYSYLNLVMTLDNKME